MIVTNIEKTKKGRYSLFVDNEFFTALHEEVFVLSKLKTGAQVDEEMLMSLQRDSQRKITRDRAIRLLSARNYSKNKLIEKLREYGEEDICKETANKMEKLGLINDSDYAMRLARDLYNLKGYRGNRIVNYLRNKGIDGDTAKEAVSQFSEEDEKDKILEILERRCKKSLTDRKERERIIAYLSRMGYNYGDIKSAINEFIENEE